MLEIDTMYASISYGHVLSSLSLFAEYTVEIRCTVSGEIVGASRYMVFFSVPSKKDSKLIKSKTELPRNCVLTFYPSIWKNFLTNVCHFFIAV